MATQTDTVRFNVGGTIFETSTTTLAKAGRNSMLGAMISDEWSLKSGTPDPYFIDRDPTCFPVLLNLLRTGKLFVPPNIPEKLLYAEAQFYGLTDQIRHAKWGSFDGNQLQLLESVSGRAPGDGTAIRASPDGGCCVAHGSMVHVYDWILEELPPITLDFQRVNDVGFIDQEHIVICACERLDRGDGGMGLFSSSTGDLRFKFQVKHENQFKSFTAGALSFNPDQNKIFASCKGRSNEYGIGVWDQITGKQVDFFYEPPGWSLGESGKLQWLPESHSLMVATLFPRDENCYISLLDFREKKMVWSWTDIGAPPSVDDKQVLDAIVVEERSSVCVVNHYDDLGFMDLRSSGGGLRWCKKSGLLKVSNARERCYPKLAAHSGQLFSSFVDVVSVYSGPDWALTSRLRRSHGGSICDFSIGGDRLFVLHNDENVFDVWEAPPPRTLQ